MLLPARRLPKRLLLWTLRATGFPLLPKIGLNACRPIRRLPAWFAAVLAQAAVADEAVGDEARRFRLLRAVNSAVFMLPVAACVFLPD